MRKLAKKVLAICLSAVMAGTMLSAMAFATESDAVSDDEYEIATLASATVISKNETKTNWSFSGDVYIEKGITLTLSGTCTISGNVYLFGTIMNRGVLTVTGTLHCLNYYNGIFTASAGNYNYGYFYDYGTLYFHRLDVTPGWLEDTEIPETTEDGDDGDDGDDNGDGGDDSGTETPSGTHITVITGEETFDNQEITGDVVIPKDTTLTTSGDVSINGNVYVLGTLSNTGTLDITGTLFCLHYDSMMSAGDFDYGYVYNYNKLNSVGMIVNDSYLSIDFPTSTVHVWNEAEWTWNEDYTSATATHTCSVCGETETVKATVESTETEDGEIIYTATATFGDGTSITDSVNGGNSTGSSSNGTGSTGTTGTGTTGSGSTSSTGSNGTGSTETTGTTGTGSTSTGSNGTGSTGTTDTGSTETTGTTGTGSTSTGSNGTGSSGTGTNGTSSTGTGSSGNSGYSGSSGNNSSTGTSPQTDDPSNTTALWMIVACFGLAGCVALAVYKVRGIKEQD